MLSSATFCRRIFFISWPPGFMDSIKPHNLCKLRKSIYGIKQAFHAWYNAIKLAILDFEFAYSQTGSSFFTYSCSFTISYCLDWVDNFILTGNSTKFVKGAIQRNGSWFSLKDMGSCILFWKVIPNMVDFFLSQYFWV